MSAAGQLLRDGAAPRLADLCRGSHPIVSLTRCACIYLYVNHGPHGTPGHPWKDGSPTMRLASRFLPALVGAWVKGGVINIWPIEPFETLMGIKG